MSNIVDKSRFFAPPNLDYGYCRIRLQAERVLAEDYRSICEIKYGFFSTESECIHAKKNSKEHLQKYIEQSKN